MKGFQGALQEVECRRKEECVCGGRRGRCMLGIDRHLSEPVGEDCRFLRPLKFFSVIFSRILPFVRH